MKKKTINAIITKRMKQWWDSIDDEDLRARVQHETVVTGGCIASMLLNEKVSDFDVYLRTEQTMFDVAEYYLKKFMIRRPQGDETPMHVERANGRIRIVIKSAGVSSETSDERGYEYFEGRPPAEAQGYVDEVYNDPGTIEDVYEDTQEQAQEAEDDDRDPFRPVFLSTNAITLSQRVQVILRFYGNPSEIHENYDFIHCTNYWTHAGGVELNQPALEALLAKELRYVGSKYPVASLFRIRKFVQRGWTINAGQILKIAMQVSDLDLNDLNILEDQLTGVDVAYFIEVLSLAKEKSTSGDHIESAYLVEIIDRMF